MNNLTLACFLALLIAGCQYKQNQTKPNVIIIMTDDQGYGDLSCYGNPIIRTPNLDDLNSEALSFTDFHVNPFCAPTRAALMTGRYSQRVCVWDTQASNNLLQKDHKITIGSPSETTTLLTAIDDAVLPGPQGDGTESIGGSPAIAGTKIDVRKARLQNNFFKKLINLNLSLTTET